MIKCNAHVVSAIQKRKARVICVITQTQTLHAEFGNTETRYIHHYRNGARTMMNEYTNVPCGGICDEIEEWAALEDDDDSVEYPCEGCQYENYFYSDMEVD